jgi:hypothetical protein
MSIVLQTLIQYWFVHKADMSPYNGTGYDPDNQPVVNYGATQLIPDCRLYDLTEAEINSLTEAGVVNATKKLLVPPSVNPVYMSKISNVRTNGKDTKKIPDVPVDGNTYVVEKSEMRRSTVDEYRQVFLRRLQ